MTTRNVRTRAKEGFGTWVPFPIETFADILVKTGSSRAAESALHRELVNLGYRRTDNGREFFVVPPFVAYCLAVALFSELDLLAGNATQVRKEAEIREAEEQEPLRHGVARLTFILGLGTISAFALLAAYFFGP